MGKDEAKAVSAVVAHGNAQREKELAARKARAEQAKKDQNLIVHGPAQQ